jgi:hypothetical protein
MRKRGVLLESLEFDARSPVDCFVLAADRLRLASFLPEKALLSAAAVQPGAPPWSFQQWKEQLRLAVRAHSLERVLNQSRGFVYSYRGLRFGRLTSLRHNKDLRYGVETAQLLGVSAGDPVRLSDPLRMCARAFRLAKAGTHFQSSTLAEDTKRHAQLRARVSLNRTHYHAVFNHRSKDPLAPRLCRQCPATPPETARHVLVHCPRYSSLRDELKKKLSTAIDRIRQARDREGSWRQWIDSENELLFHTILASPFVLSQFPTLEDRLYLLRCTGNFLLSVHDIRPT